MNNKPTIIDTLRGVKDDFKKMGINIVSTVKSTRHTAGHLGMKNNVRNLRKNLGLQEEGVIAKIRNKVSSEETIIPRPGYFIDNEGRPKFPIYNKIKDITKKKEEDQGTETQTDNTEESTTSESMGKLYDRDLGDISGRDLGGIYGQDLGNGKTNNNKVSLAGPN